MCKSLPFFLVAVFCLTASGSDDTIAYFPGSRLYQWNLDHPDSEQVQGALLEGVVTDITALPNEKRLIMLTNLSGETVRDEMGALMTADPCHPQEVSLLKVSGVRSFVHGAVVSPDGRILYAIGTPVDELKSGESEFSCLIIDIDTGKLENSFPSSEIYAGPQARIYYRTLMERNDSASRTALMSRDAKGMNPREEVTDLPYFERGGLCGLFAVDGSLWAVFNSHLHDPSEEFLAYCMKERGSLTLVCRHSGSALWCDKAKIYFRPTGSIDLAVLDCRVPSTHEVLTAYFCTTPPPYKDVNLLADATIRISPDGSKHFFLVDRGISEPIDLYAFDIGTKTWSPKYTTSRPFNGGTPAPVLLADPCRKGTAGKPDRKLVDRGIGGCLPE
jgi:hypothetical protein